MVAEYLVFCWVFFTLKTWRERERERGGEPWTCIFYLIYYQIISYRPDCCGLSSNKTFVKNGMNPEKKYLQVHYLKVRYFSNLSNLSLICTSKERVLSRMFLCTCMQSILGIFPFKIPRKNGRIFEVSYMSQEVCAKVSRKTCFISGRFWLFFFNKLLHVPDFLYIKWMIMKYFVCRKCCNFSSRNVKKFRKNFTLSQAAEWNALLINWAFVLCVV